MYLYNNEFILGSNVVVAATTILIYDFFVTFGHEITYIWMRPWTFGTALFLGNRYLVFVDTFIYLYLQFSVTTVKQCESFHWAIVWMIAVGTMWSELILLLRTWAMWQRARIIFIILGGMSSLTFGPGIALTYLEAKSLKFIDVPSGGVGCNLQSSSKLIMVTYVLLFLSETVIVVLTLMRGREHLRSSQSTWVKHIYRHGLRFYIYLLLITVANMLVPVVTTGPAFFKLWLAIPLRIFHSIFCNRVILLISRQRSYRTPSDMGASVEMQNRRGSINKTENILDTALDLDTRMTRHTQGGMITTVQSDVGEGYSGEIDRDGGESQAPLAPNSFVYRGDWTR